MNSASRTLASDFEITIDIRDASGKGRRVKTSVSCGVPVIAGMPVVCAASKPNGWPCTWKGRDGVSMRPFHEIARDRAGVERPTPVVDTGLGSQIKGLTEHDLLGLHSDRHALTNEVFFSASNKEAIAWTDESAWHGCDLAAAVPRVEALRRSVSNLLGIQDGILHLAQPLPSWWVDPDRSVVQLSMPLGTALKSGGYRYAASHHLIWTYAADRLDHALTYQRRRRPGADVELRGSIDFIDPAYAPGTNLPDVAGVVCAWLAMMMRCPVADLPSEMVRKWHEVALGSTAAWNEGPQRAAEILENAVSFARDLMAFPNAFKGRRLQSQPFWLGLLERLEVEGIPAHGPALATIPEAAGA